MPDCALLCLPDCAEQCPKCWVLLLIFDEVSQTHGSFIPRWPRHCLAWCNQWESPQCMQLCSKSCGTPPQGVAIAYQGHNVPHACVHEYLPRCEPIPLSLVRK